MAKRKTKANRKRKIPMGSKKLAGQELRGEVREEVPVSNQDVSSGRSDSIGRGEDNSTGVREGGVADGVQYVPPSSSTGAPPQLNYQTVESIEDLQECAAWLIDLGNEIDKTMVGIAVYRDEIAFATPAKVWKVPTDIYAAKDVLRNVLVSEKAAPALISRDAKYDINQLDKYLKLTREEKKILSRNFVHDMRALEYVTGYSLTLNRGSLPITNDALDAATVGTMMAIDLPPYYTQVAMPLIGYTPVLADEETSRWSIIYEHLLFRILAHYTQDPTIVSLLNDNQDPMEKFAEIVELDKQQAQAFLLWMCCGEDMSVLNKYHRLEAREMPESPQLIKATKIDKKIPTLRLGLIRMIEQFTNNKRAHTLYGRQSPLGSSREELLHFVLFGSISDILDVVMVSLLNLGSDTHVLLIEGSTNYPYSTRALIVGRTDQPAIEWQNQLEQLAPLNNPLNQVTLNPKVSVV